MSRLLSYYGDYDKPVPPHTGGRAKTLSCDLAVVGGGGAGLSAAARAAELGARVVVVEKMTELGGNSRLAGGLLCTNSGLLQKAGVPDTTAAHIDRYRRANLYRLDDAIFSRFVSNTGRYYDWLAAHGLDTENRRVIMDNVLLIRDRTQWEPLHNPAYGPGLMGSAVTDVLIRLVREYGVTVLLPAQVTALKTKDGAVTGVTAVGNGFDYDISAENTVLACGGFGVNNGLLKEYFPKYFSSENYFTHYCLSHCTGDGIGLARNVGARTGENMSIGLEAMNHMPGAYSIQRLIGQPQGVLVSATGRRFLPEDDMENGEYAMDAQPDGVGWYVFTQAVMGRLYALARENARFGDWMPEQVQLELDLAAELKSGLVKRGDTVPELAAAIGAPPQTLARTLSRYETFCAQGRDDEYGKDPKYLLPLGGAGPWYAVRLTRKFDVTMGGVSVDSHIRALRPDGSPVPGLYVCGDIASGWMSEDYGPIFSSFAWAVNSGFLAAEECCGVL